MDEILFENKYVRDESDTKELYGYHFFKRPILVFLYALMGLFTLSVILELIFNPNPYTLVNLFLIVGFALIVTVGYFSSVKTSVSREKEAARGQDFLVNVKVSQQEIAITTPISNQSVDFEGVIYAFVTKNYIFAVTKARFVYIFKKDSFVLGDAESFIAFLRNKGIKIKK